MKPLAVVKRRSAIIFTFVAALAIAGIVGLSKAGADNSYVDYIGTKLLHVKAYFGGTFGSSGHNPEDEAEDQRKVVVTSPMIEDVTITESFVCQIRAQRHIDVRALEGGYLNKIWIEEGQTVKKGQVMFDILPTLYKARFAAESAKATVARLKYQYTEQLAKDKVVSKNEVSLQEAEKDEAQAKANLAEAELNFTDVKAPFDGIVDRLLQREGSLIKEGDILTTLADNSVMWVYFNVPEKYYLQYMAHKKQREAEDKIELVLANGDIFPQPGKIGAIEADFNNQHGNIKFRADFPNPDILLRHGQTGKIKILRPFKNAMLIPQRATFQLLDKRYVWVIDDDHVAHQKLITVKHELEDVFIVGSGLTVKDKIVLEGLRDVEEGAKVQYTFVAPQEVLQNQKFRAE
ncbi:MAG TPA: efflux RND transporter periplasmic adaptor subunit [Pirellulales bacterium]|nr:efflux RND transporter periplasmic adaptor subunit [Pirellulales bacterium]